MKKIYIITMATVLCQVVKAQLPEDALRFSYQKIYGSARNMAIGGSMIGLGGEISSIHLNPAGLGFYKNREYVIGGGINKQQLNNIDYRNIKNQKGPATYGFDLGTIGVVIGESLRGSNKKSAALGLSLTKTANYNSNYSYQGYNNNSSGAEKFAEEIVAGRYDIGNAFTQRFLSLGSRLANYSYLVDTFTLGGVKQVVAMTEFTNGILQESSVETRGAAHELSLAGAINRDEKLFIGGSISVPFSYLTKTSVYSEKDTTAATNNGFNNFIYTEEGRTNGWGLNGKLGIIYRPAPRVRLGATLHTPNFMSYTDIQSGTMSVKLENVAGISRSLVHTATVKTEDVADGASEIRNNVVLITPWRLGIGGSLVFNETKNVKKQRGFIAADIEYITYKTMRFSSGEEENVVPDNYYKPTNDAIKQVYRNTFNFKVGGEVKFNTIMFRLGANYFGNPNANTTDLKQSQINLSTGLGYRNKDKFIDFTFIYGINKNVDFPYRLADKPNTFANMNGRAGTIMITYGKKF